MADQAREGLLSPWLQRRRCAVARPWLQGRVLDFGCGNSLLPNLVAAQVYVGVDRDPGILARARHHHPGHRFVAEIPPEQFDTIAALAVIEHVVEPQTLLLRLAGHLAPGGQIVLTSPHPRADLIHGLGARFGLFSRHAHEEHEACLTAADMAALARQAGLRLAACRRFQLGLNQLFVLKAAA